jgi:hypothetical protein
MSNGELMKNAKIIMQINGCPWILRILMCSGFGVGCYAKMLPPWTLNHMKKEAEMLKE